MILESLTLQPSSVSCATCRALRHLDWLCAALPPQSSLSTPTLIGLVVPTPDGRLPVTQSFSETTLCHGLPSDTTQSPGLARRMNTVLWRMASQKLLGYVSCSLSFSALLAVPLWSIVIMSVLSISPAIQCSISGRSTLRSISTLFERRLPSVTFGLLMFLQHHSTPTSSPRGFLLLCFKSFGPAWPLAMLPIRLRGSVSMM